MKARAALLAALCAALLPAGCAHIEAPPGGPEDKTPPEVIAVRPDTSARLSGFRDPVVIVFDERLSEQGVEEAVLVSPRTSPVSVDKRGDELRIGLRRGWEEGRIYHVTVLPKLRDLFGNVRTEPVRLVFSTGPEIPDTRLAGTVVDRVTGRPEVGARVEAILHPDSLVYALPSDSAGEFAFARIPEGEYAVRAYRDLDVDRELDPFEPRDTARAVVRAGEPAAVALRVLQPDTTAPRIASVEVADSALEVKFDDHLDPAQEVTPAQVALLLPDGTPVPVARVEVGRPAAAPAPADTAAVAAPREEERLPSQSLFVYPARPLPPETEVRVRVSGVRNLHGLAGGGEAAVKTPAAAPPPAEEGAPPPP